MPERVPADHPSVETVRATVERVGRTDRAQVVLPEDVPVTEEVVRLVVEGDSHRASVERNLGGSLAIRGAYDTPEQARDRSGEDHLAAWVGDAGLSFGRTVLVDVIEAGFLYGLRAPGEEAVYEVPNRPDSSLASLAERLEGDR